MNKHKVARNSVGAENRACDVKTVSNVSDKPSDSFEGDFIQAPIIANRHRLSPIRARVVCLLAGIGGRWI